LEGTLAKSPLDAAGKLFGCAPGATSTRQTYLLRALTEPFSANDSLLGSSCWNHSGDVMSASGGIQPWAAASTDLYASRRP